MPISRSDSNAYPLASNLSATGANTPVPDAGLVSFNFGGAAVRIVMKDGEPWWIAADVCAVLGIVKPADAIIRLDDDERSTTPSTGGGPDRNIINESGLYSLVVLG